MSIDKSLAQQLSANRLVDPTASDDSEQFNIAPVPGKSFEYLSKDTRVNMRMPGDLLAAVKDASAKMGIRYQQFVRLALEKALDEHNKE